MLEIPQFVIDRAKSNQPFFAADEVGCWPEGLLQQLLDSDVLTPGPNARSISCDACRDDHLEDVQFVKSPSGSGLRAYIPCPEVGRVQVPLERLKRWQVNLANAIAFARVDGGRTDVRTAHLHYEAGHGAYICIIDEMKRPFDFVTSRFQRIDELEKPEQACLIATGRADSRAGFGFSYTASFDVYQLVANIPDSAVPPDGLTFSIRWLIQKGNSPSPKTDTVLLDSARIRFLNGQFSSVDTSSQEMFDEDISFAKRQRWAEEKKEFQEQELDKHAELSGQLASALTAANVAETLRVLAESIAFWAKGLKKHLIDHFYFDAQDPFFCRVYQTPPGASFQFVPFWLTQPWIGMQEVYDLLEFHKSTEIAKAFSTRMDALIEARDKFIDQVVESTRRFEWRIDIESFVFLDEQRKDLRHRAIVVCEYLALIATQFEASRLANAASVENGLVGTSIQEPKSLPKSNQAKEQRKSWIQPDLDKAIREYKAKRASSYRDLLDGVRAGGQGAKKAAQQMFGRNAISRELGVKAKAMVSKSPEWLAIAEELQLSHGKDRNNRKLAKVGLDIAIETSAADASQTVLDIAVQNETIRLVRASLPVSDAAALIEKLQCGEITDDQARMLVDVVKDQKRDDRTRKVRSVS